MRPCATAQHIIAECNIFVQMQQQYTNIRKYKALLRDPIALVLSDESDISIRSINQYTRANSWSCMLKY